MTTWTPEELALLAGTESLVLTAGDDVRDGQVGGEDSQDGDDRVEIGMVLVHGELYVRAHRGTSSRWYRAARKHGHGRIRVGDVTRDVLLETCDTGLAAEIDAAYRNKYGPMADTFVTGPAARAATVRITPAPSTNDAAGPVR